MKTNFEMVKEFNTKFGRKIYPDIPTFIPAESLLQRLRLIEEEKSEFIEALCLRDMIKIAKELADFLYTVYGAADEMGIPIDSVFKAVHDSNMTKENKRDAAGKVLKGDNYKEPNIEKVLSEAIHGKR